MDVVVSEEDFMAMDFMDTPDLVTLDIHIMAMALDTHITHIVGSVFFFENLFLDGRQTRHGVFSSEKMIKGLSLQRVKPVE